jgi:uncharacterized protein YbgA (DUF1722 family)/uncharacterized protein YbbK (DUF523 family)
MSLIESKPQIGVSACLMGKPVRFDGGHKQNRFVLDQCAEYFDLHSVCPEAELGLGIPRPVIQLRSFDEEIKLVYSKNPESELTSEMRAFSEKRVSAFNELDGFIFKKDSPSCGMERVPVFNNKTGMRQRNGIGVFAETFKKRHPNVPTEDEGRLGDIGIRENFLERVYAHYRWRQVKNAENALHAFREFHKNYKLILMAKNNAGYRELGRLVAGLNKNNLNEIREIYFSKFMQVMAKIPSRGHHVNVLMHMMGYLKDKLDSKDKAELLQWFETYRRQQVTRVTPLVLLQHHFNRHPNDYMADQYYFDPFPTELMHPV